MILLIIMNLTMQGAAEANRKRSEHLPSTAGQKSGMLHRRALMTRRPECDSRTQGSKIRFLENKRGRVRRSLATSSCIFSYNRLSRGSKYLFTNHEVKITLKTLPAQGRFLQTEIQAFLMCSLFVCRLSPTQISLGNQSSVSS
jgi:hypothetical protein